MCGLHPNMKGTVEVKWPRAAARPGGHAAHPAERSRPSCLP